MKRLLFLSVLTLTASVSSFGAAEHAECNTDDTVTAQASALLKVAEKLEDEECPAPTASDYKKFCESISIQEKPTEKDKQYFEFGYERRLMDLSCTSVGKDGQEGSAEKIKKMWSKYSKNFGCQSSSFNVNKGSVLKYAVVTGFKPFLETIVGTYGLDINFVDTADQRNVLDYVNDELTKATQELGATHSKVKILKEYKIFLEDLGGIPSQK